MLVSKRYSTRGIFSLALLAVSCFCLSGAQAQTPETQPPAGNEGQVQPSEPGKPPTPRRVPERPGRRNQPQPGRPDGTANDAAPATPPAGAENPASQPAQPTTPPMPARTRPEQPRRGGADGPAAQPSGDGTAGPDAAETARKLQEALGNPQAPPVPPPNSAQPNAAQPAPETPPGTPPAGQPAGNEPRKTAAQRAAERRKQMQSGKTEGDASAGNPSTGNPNPSGFDAGGGEPAPDAGPTTAINIPPVEDNVPPEQKTYSFSIKDGTYEQLMEGFARQTGLGVLGDAPKEGRVSFVTTETLTFDQALARMRMLLFNYKPHEPYWLLREMNNLKIVRINDIYRVLPQDRMFRSVEVFRAANLSQDELALVIYTPKTGSIADLRQVRDFLPDYVRVAPVENSNSVSIFALVSDIEKYLWLIDFFSNKEADPRTIVRIDVHHIMASEAVTRLTLIMSLDASGVPKMTTPGGGGGSRRPREPSPIDNMAEPAVTIIPDDIQGVLIVRAMQDKIDEIKTLLPFIDVDTSGQDFKPVIIKLQHADAETMVGAIQQVLQIGGSGGGSAPNNPAPPAAPKSGKKKKGSVAGTALVSAEQIHMFAHPTDNAIVVMAEESGVQQVRDLVALFDVQTRADWVKIPLENVDATDASGTINSVLGGAVGGGGGGKGKAAPETFQIVVDPHGDALWFSGSQKDLDQARQIIATIDGAVEPVKLRVVTLKHQTPTFVASMLREIDQSGTGAVVGAPPGGKKSKKAQGGAQPVVASKFTADDDQGKLFMLCTDREWEKYKPYIDQLEADAAGGEAMVRLTLAHLEPQEAIERLQNVLTASGEATDSANLVASDGSILVFDTDAKVLERLKLLLAEIDKPSTVEERTFDIKFANAGDIKTAIETLVGDSSAKTPKMPRKKDKGGAPAAEASVTEELTVLQVGDRLVVRTTPQRMEKVAKIVEEFDVSEARTELKVYSDFPRGTDIAGIADTIKAVMIGGTKTRGNRSKEGTPSFGGEGPQFIPQPAAGKLIVLAEPSQFAEVEKLLNVLRSGGEAAPPVVEFIELKHAEPGELVDAIQPLVEIKVRQLVAAGELSEEDLDDGSAGPKRKKGASPASGMGGRFHISPDPRNSRIVIAAPQVVVDQVRELVTQFDKPGKESDEAVFKTVELMNASPADMVKAVNEMRGRAPAAKRKPTKRGEAAEILASSTPTPLVVMEAPGGGSKVVLHGSAEDVDEAIAWIQRLDVEAAAGRQIKVYNVQYADVGKLVDFIINVVEATSGPDKKKAPKRKDSESESDEEEEFVTTRTYLGKDMYLQADLIADTIMVSTTPAKIRQIDDVMKQFDAGEEQASVLGPDSEVPSRIIELKFADPDTAVSDLGAYLSADWKPRDELPHVSTLGIGNAIRVEYPDENRFAEIEAVVAKFIDKPSPKKTKIERKAIPVPAGMSARDFALHLQSQNPTLKAKLIEAKEEDLAAKYPNIIEVRPPQRPAANPNKVNPCVLPKSLTSIAAFGSMLVAQPERAADSEDSSDETKNQNSIQQEKSVPDDVLRRTGLPVPAKEKPKAGVEKEPINEAPAKEKKSTKKESSSPTAEPSEEVKIHVDPKENVIILEGPSGELEDIDEWMKDFKEIQDQLRPKPDIRIFQLRYIDVNSAARLIDEMFNASRQDRQAMQNQQQQAMRQQAQQQRQQQQRRGEGEQEGQDGQPGQGPQRRGQQPQQPQQQVAMPQLPPSSVWVSANERDRSLIIRAETSLYPQIIELLARIDQPKPIDSEFRTYPLEKLNAADVEEWLKEMLELDEPATRRASRTRSGGGPAGPGGQPGMGGGALITEDGGSLPQTILQNTVQGTNQLSLDPQDINLFSSETGNAIMVMAPPKAQEFIKGLIQQLESGDIPQRITKFYELKHADADELAEHLAAHFEKQNAQAGGARRSSGGEGASPAGSRTMNTPSFVPYARLNQLTVHATETQIKEVDELVARFDVGSGQDEWQDVVLQHADAGMLADVLTSMFAEGPLASKGGKGPSSSSASRGGTAKFIGDNGGRMLFFNAPRPMHEQILATIQKAEGEAKQSRSVRTIELKHAAPSAVAEAIESAFGHRAGGSSRSKSSPPGSNSTGSSASARFTVTGHDGSKRLFVTADDRTFAEITSLIAILDQPGMASVEFRIYPLQFANARAVHAQMSKLLTDFIKRLPPGEKVPGLDAFSVEPDEASNSLVVLGSPSVFGFIEENLRKIDNPAAKVGQQTSVIIPLASGNAQEIAVNMKAIMAGKEQTPGLNPPVIEANPASNVLIVRGTQAQIDEIKQTVAQIDGQGVPSRAIGVNTIKLKFADPAAAADAVTKMFKTDSRNPRDAVTATGDYTSNSLLISSSPENFKRVQDLMAQIDNAEVSQQDVHVVEIKHADSTAVAQTLNEIFVRAAQQKGQGAGPQISISAVQGSRAILVRAKGEEFVRIEAAIKELDNEQVGTAGDVRIVTMSYADAGEIAKALEAYLTNPITAAGRGPKLLGDTRISALPQSNSVMISAATEEVERLVAIAKNMDIAGEKGSVPQIIPLKYANVALILHTVQEIFTQNRAVGLAGRTSALPPPVIVADESSNALIVKASPTDLKAVQGIVAQLDTEDKKNKAPFRLIKVEPGINVTDLAEQVEMTLNESVQAHSATASTGAGMMGRSARAPTISVVPILRSNSLLVSGYAPMFDQAEDLVRKIEALGPTGNLTTRIVSTPNIKTEDIQRLIDQLTNQDGNNRGGARRGTTRQQPNRPPPRTNP